MWKKILTMSLVLVMVLSFTACTEETEEEVELPSAQEIVDGVLESELQQVQRQLKTLDREQKQLLHWAIKSFPEEMVTSENKRINKERSSLESREAELERQFQESHEAASIPKMEEYIQLVQEKLITLDFDMKLITSDKIGAIILLP